jgi:hypothetical protein
MSLELNLSGGGETLATDVVGSEHYQVMKMATGGPTEAVPVSTENPLPTQHAAPLFWRVGFAEVGSGLQGLAAAEMTLLQTGPGMTVSQAGGNLVIATGTTVNSETVLRSNLTFKGSLLARYKAILSQRIANQTFRFELADLIGTGLAYTINSATSVTVTIPSNPYTAANVGQSLRLSMLSSVGIPMRAAIAAVSGSNVTFTVAGWPASGSGVLTLYGHNWLANEYSGTTATNSSFDCQRRGWASGNTTATINTTASPGHIGQIAFDVLAASLSDALVASNTGYQWANRATRLENIPDEDVSMHFFIVVQNGSTAPASTTTLTVGFLQVEDQGRNKVRITSADPVGSHPQQVQIMGGTTAVTGTVTANIGTGSLAAGTNAIGDVGAQYRANATGGATPHHIVSAATTNALNVKASAGRVVGWGLVNTTASWQYVKLHNTASAPTAGAGVVMTIAIPPNGVNNSPPSFAGIGFGTGIGRTIVTGSADADATATTAGAVVGDIYFA